MREISEGVTSDKENSIETPRRTSLDYQSSDRHLSLSFHPGKSGNRGIDLECGLPSVHKGVIMVAPVPPKKVHYYVGLVYGFPDDSSLVIVGFDLKSQKRVEDAITLFLEKEGGDREKARVFEGVGNGELGQTVFDWLRGFGIPEDVAGNSVMCIGGALLEVLAHMFDKHSHQAEEK